MQVGMQGEQIGFMHMGQDDILFMADTQFIMTIEVCQIGHGAHLIGAGVARGLARMFNADAYNGIVGVAMEMGVGVYPCAKSRLAAIVLLIGLHRGSFEFWCSKSGSDCVQKSLILAVETVPQQVKSGTHHGSSFFNAVLMYRNLNPCFIFIVAPAQQVPNADNSLEIGQQVRWRYELVDYLANHWRVAQAAANQHFEPNGALSFNHPESDVMGAGCRPVAVATRDKDFQLAWHKLELRVISRPLADQFGTDLPIHPTRPQQSGRR